MVHVRLLGTVRVGVEIRGGITHPGYKHLVIGCVAEKMIPWRSFSYRWHPRAIDGTFNDSAEPRTLVEFTLEESPVGTALTGVESGFDHIPLARQAEVLDGNEGCSAAQMNALGA